MIKEYDVKIDYGEYEWGDYVFFNMLFAIGALVPYCIFIPAPCSAFGGFGQIIVGILIAITAFMIPVILMLLWNAVFGRRYVQIEMVRPRVKSKRRVK